MSHQLNLHDSTNVIVFKPGQGIMLGFWNVTGAPTDGLAGYGVGCTLINTVDAKLYINGGTLTSTLWKLVTSA